MYERGNRVGGTGLFPVPTSHTTVRTVRYTAVLQVEGDILSPLCFRFLSSKGKSAIPHYCRVPIYRFEGSYLQIFSAFYLSFSNFHL
jgi:hypothetical protein